MASILSLRSGDRPRTFPSAMKPKDTRKAQTLLNDSILLEDFSQEVLDSAIIVNTQILLEEEDEEETVPQENSALKSKGDDDADGEQRGDDTQKVHDPKNEDLQRSLEFTQGEVDDLKDENAFLKQVLSDLELEMQRNMQ